MSSDFYGYASALLGYWWLLVSSFVFTSEQFIEQFIPPLKRWMDKHVHKERKRRFLNALALLCIFIAGFLAWRDEHAAHETVRTERDSARGERDQAQGDLGASHDRIADKEREIGRLSGDLQRVTRERDLNKEGLDTANAEVSRLNTELTRRPPLPSGGPRWLNDEQKVAVVTALRALGEQRAVEINILSGSTERMRYAQDFADIFATVGWPIRPATVGVIIPLPLSGLGIDFLANDSVAQHFVGELRKHGVALDESSTEPHAAGSFTLTIGPKPE